jgi:hypothetical protein
MSDAEQVPDATRWEVFVKATINRKGCDDELVFDDAATVRYPPTMDDKTVLVDFLREMANDIEAGRMTPGSLSL